MLGLLSKNKVHQIGIQNSNEYVPNKIYYRDFYPKDFKYIGPEVLEASKKSKIMKFLPKDEKSMVQKWLAEVLRGLKQFFYGGSLHGVKLVSIPLL